MAASRVLAFFSVGSLFSLDIKVKAVRAYVGYTLAGSSWVVVAGGLSFFNDQINDQIVYTHVRAAGNRFWGNWFSNNASISSVRTRASPHSDSMCL